MKVDGNLVADLPDIAQRARDLEAAGYSAGLSIETNHDPFLPLLMAAEHSQRLELMTAVAIAFARNPMTVAYTANDVHAFSGGRLLLGLGSQVSAHIQRRFSMPWSHPAPRMREFISAMRAIWDAWDKGTRLNFRGDFYQHTLMTPFFTPPPNPHGAPMVFLGALGERMAEVAGEVADGILVHPMATERYLREHTVPAVLKGLERSGRARERFQVAIMPFVISGVDEQEMESWVPIIRQQIAFYGSTPAYRCVLELHGWGDLQEELNALSKEGRWVEMGALITDEMLEVFATRAGIDELASALGKRFGGVADRITLHVPLDRDRERWGAVIKSLQQEESAAVVG
jgi:probable F420-dependent oxidoreductase